MDKGGSDKREDLAVREATSTTIARETFADEGIRRQRAERGLIQPFEKVAAAGAVEPHRPRVEIREELGDPGVEGGEGEEGLVPEGSVTSGFKMVFRSWAPGTDPASLPLSEMPKSIVVSRKALPPPNGSNGNSAPAGGYG